MLKTLFGDIHSGKLKRLPYLGYSLLISFLAVLFFLLIAAAIGVVEHMIGGDLQQAQEQLQEDLSLPAILVFGVLVITLLYCAANILAKRIRDTGLPGWATVFIIMFVTGVISFLVSPDVSNILHFAIMLAFLLIPSNTFSRT